MRKSQKQVAYEEYFKTLPPVEQDAQNMLIAEFIVALVRRNLRREVQAAMALESKAGE